MEVMKTTQEIYQTYQSSFLDTINEVQKLSRKLPPAAAMLLSIRYMVRVIGKSIVNLYNYHYLKCCNKENVKKQKERRYLPTVLRNTLLHCHQFEDRKTYALTEKSMQLVIEHTQAPSGPFDGNLFQGLTENIIFYRHGEEPFMLTLSHEQFLVVFLTKTEEGWLQEEGVTLKPALHIAETVGVIKPTTIKNPSKYIVP